MFVRVSRGECILKFSKLHQKIGLKNWIKMAGSKQLDQNNWIKTAGSKNIHINKIIELPD
jgi:hypothetical protein